jgi:hypothetical protein
MARIRTREVEVPVAEAAVQLQGQRLAGRLVRLERGKDEFVHPLELETRAVGGDRLQRDEGVRACSRDDAAQMI